MEWNNLWEDRQNNREATTVIQGTYYPQVSWDT